MLKFRVDSEGSITDINHLKTGDKKEFSDTLGHLLNKQEKMLLAGGLATSDHADVKSMNPTIVKLMLANHDYSDKTTNEHTGADGGPIETKTSFNFIPVGKND